MYIAITSILCKNEVQSPTQFPAVGLQLPSQMCNIQRCQNFQRALYNVLDPRGCQKWYPQLSNYILFRECITTAESCDDGIKPAIIIQFQCIFSSLVTSDRQPYSETLKGVFRANSRFGGAS
ncbi:Hypothetical_protein [Hexamita inflata]|uniref:Hypothetical_protein n=1 Tax=Hexamita inflata TaxID=28002 RepID=A0AA86NZC6_9EUKA|nr:Hypothetical protein HINF_LOCUS16489 [Hexamita inflata]